MTKILVIALWPVGIGVIVAVGALLARRDSGGAGEVRGASHRPHGWPARHAGSPSLIRRLLTGLGVLAAGLAVTYAVVALAGLLIVHGGPVIDKPIFGWLALHRVHWWKDLMDVATQLGLKWTNWGAAVVAGLGLAWVYRDNRWLPPAAMLSLIVIDHYLVRAVTSTFHRLPPPGSGGTFPSGGSDRVIVFYGLIAYLAWRELSGRRGPAVWMATAVAALGFNEAYSRTYLGFHWFTDTLGGLLLGSLELTAFVVAVRVIAGPVAAVRGESRSKTAREATAQPSQVSLPTPLEGDSAR